MHNRKYVPGIVDLVKGRVKNLGKTGHQDYVENLIIQSNFLKDAPFRWVGLIYWFGEKNETKPTYKHINKKYGDLPISIELKMEVLSAADKKSVEVLSQIMLIGALDALIDVGRKYDLPTQTFERARALYTHIPETVDEVNALSDKGLKV